MSKNIPCPLCKRKNSSFKCKYEKFVYKKCLFCGLIYLSNPPNQAYFNKLYAYPDDKKYWKSLKKVNPLQELFLNTPGLFNILLIGGEMINRNWVNSANKIAQGKRVLDVGCGPGVFLEKMKIKGYDVYGIEVGERLVGEVSSKLGKGRIIKGELSNVFGKFIKKKLNIVTFWHVFEHIKDIHENLKATSLILASKGELIIEVPHSESINFKIFGKYWTFLMTPQHFHFWNEKTITKILQMHRLEPQRFEYPTYFSFVFASSLIKRYHWSLIFAPILMPISIAVAYMAAILGRGDVIRVYAKKV